MTPEEAYDHICEIAKEHALILNAFGGVVTIVHPDTQRAESLYEHIQYVHGLGSHPDTLERERAEVSNVLIKGQAAFGLSLLNDGLEGNFTHGQVPDYLC